MIPSFIGKKPVAVPQTGEVTSFVRRKPEQSEIPDGLTQRQLYDYIRMLDGEGYPTAFKRYDGGKVYYKNARFEDNQVIAEAIFIEENQ